MISSSFVKQLTDNGRHGLNGLHVMNHVQVDIGPGKEFAQIQIMVVCHAREMHLKQKNVTPMNVQVGKLIGGKMASWPAHSYYRNSLK